MYLDRSPFEQDFDSRVQGVTHICRDSKITHLYNRDFVQRPFDDLCQQVPSSRRDKTPFTSQVSRPSIKKSVRLILLQARTCSYHLACTLPEKKPHHPIGPQSLAYCHPKTQSSPVSKPVPWLLPASFPTPEWKPFSWSTISLQICLRFTMTGSSLHWWTSRVKDTIGSPASSSTSRQISRRGRPSSLIYLLHQRQRKTMTGSRQRRPTKVWGSFLRLVVASSGLICMITAREIAELCTQGYLSEMGARLV